jgi:serine/threonine-protein kinase
MIALLLQHPGPAIGTILWLGAVLLYLVLALPRLESLVAAAITAGIVAGLLVVSLALPAPVGLALLVGAAALAFGHIGWWLNARDRTPRDSSASLPALQTGPTDSGQSLPTAAAQRALGRYVIEREIGRGSMGAVYLGRDPKIGRLVAIKTLALSREFAGDELTEARKRFFREAETAGRLQHRDIVTIFDAGEDQGLAYIAMEYLKGDNLQSFTQAPNLLAVSVVCRTVARVADALAHAHSQGIVHRDIKPANVMVELEADIVKVTDFGIARIADASRTRTGMVLGTPSFMSPEQLAGRRVDGRSDLYSVGVMLFQMLTGRLPHQSESMATLMQQIANDPAPDIRSVRAGLPAELAKIVAATLEKRAEDRYGDGRQLAADLLAFAVHFTEDGPSMPVAAAHPPDSSGFQATTKLGPRDPRHNSSF